MKLNESQKRRIYKSVMNDVAKVTKRILNEDTLPTGIDADVELDKYETEEKQKQKEKLRDIVWSIISMYNNNKSFPQIWQETQKEISSHKDSVIAQITDGKKDVYKFYINLKNIKSIVNTLFLVRILLESSDNVDPEVEFPNQKYNQYMRNIRKAIIKFGDSDRKFEAKLDDYIDSSPTFDSIEDIKNYLLGKSNPFDLPKFKSLKTAQSTILLYLDQHKMLSRPLKKWSMKEIKNLNDFCERHNIS